jgi:hypothetical protein
MPRFRAARPSTAVTPHHAGTWNGAQLDVVMTLDDRRATAFRRAFPLLATSIPTADILAAYLDDVLQS